MQTTDQRNPGRRQVQRYSVSGALSGNKANQETTPVEFLVLKNCLIDKRQDAVVPRPGSAHENLPNGLGTPLGTGEFTEAANAFIPVKRTLISNFGGTTFYKNEANVWSSLTVSPSCSFSANRQTCFNKLGGTMIITSGLPAKWKGGSTMVDRVGIVPPAAAITITSTASGSGITLTSGTQYMYTYRDSVSGLESDWSPLSASSGAVANKSIAISIPSATIVNWDTIRVYRTLDGGIFPYLVTTLAAGNSTYTDSTPDASLTTKANNQYDNAVPPTEVNISAKYAQCIWMVDAVNPYKLVFSKPHTGADVDIEYYPINNYVISNDPITGLLVVPGKMLVFHPRSISYISGYSVDDFVFQSFIPGVGTCFHSSISTNGTDTVFLAEQGFVSIPSQGGLPRHLSREIDHQLQPLLAGSYNSTLYCSTCWNPSLRQFIFLISAVSSASAPWEDSVTAALGAWENSVTTVTDTWEEASGVAIADEVHSKIWGWSPELSRGDDFRWMEYEFPDIEDGNVNGNYAVYLFHPSPSSDTADPQQDKTYLGGVAGTGNGIRTIFRRDTATDFSSVGAVDIQCLLITGRISPGENDLAYKYFHGLGFSNSYSDPTADGDGTIKYLVDFDDPHLRTYASSLVTISDSTDLKKFPTALARHIHLVISDVSSNQDKIILGEFSIHFRERFRREGR